MDNRQYNVQSQGGIQVARGSATGAISPEATKVLRNTYTLLAMTLLFSAVMAGVSMSIGLSQGVSLVCSLGALALVWLVLPRTANSAAGIGVVFAFTGLLGLSLGPILMHYLQFANGSQIVMQALGGTAVVFLGLSGYVLTTKKDFSFMRGMLVAGMMVVIVGMLGAFVASLFGVQVTAFSLAMSAAIVFLMSGFILYDTSRIVNGGETNYIMATTGLYLNIYNLFVSLLHLIGAFTGED
ncbi:MULTISPECIES: Bax inhibitor-1/YccA family protein [Marinobacter]|uniref:Modulator of FtsH protease YccA n=1 Tax=Marinobacter litoralis TaxID=187981 RepID=A0A3M2RM58_9GAMM|nr:MULTISPECIES: Bax inhibitor-1/YccA family protein [Marinobacter]MBJ6137807.1 Bax inhibitor-1/YccA family protein [Marinobacter litoralis]MBR9870937.1 Bax inhibitor-1/YccA family protein [Gammaproteobacteria bacterium]MDP4546285.1 Bax inhibitor-1/YccA family protein [Marinobacter sp. MDS2]RMJ06252.1 Modulator of FtsH protease YccA [Marinobacter litoralis]